MRKNLIGSLLSFLLVVVMAGSAGAADLGQLLTEGMQSLQAQKGVAELLAITNAPYLRLEGEKATTKVGVIEQVTGCTVGSGNMLFLNRPSENHLRVMLFSKKNGKAVLIGETDKGMISEAMVISRDALLQQKFWADGVDMRFNKDLAAYAPLAQVWSEDVPYLYLKAAERHGDICPGIAAGYMIGEYIRKHYPLQPGQAYYYLAAPAWCKDDAIPLVLGITHGKQHVVVKHLSEEQLKEIPIPKPTGFALLWDKDKKAGKGAVFSFDFKAVQAMLPKGFGNRKAAMTIIMLEYLNKPETFVTTAGEFDLTQQLFEQMLQAGTNPYKLTGFVKEQGGK